MINTLLRSTVSIRQHKSPSQKIVQKLNHRKLQLKKEIDENCQKIKNFPELVHKKKQIANLKQRHKNNLTKIATIDQLIQELTVQLQRKEQQLMKNVFLSENLQLQLQEHTQRAIGNLRYEFGFDQQSSKSQTFLLYQLDQQIDHKFSKKLISFLNPIFRNHSYLPSSPLEYLIDHNLVQQFEQKLMMQNQQPQQAWEKLIKTLRSLSKNQKRQVDSKKVIDEALQKKINLKQIRKQVDQLTEQINNIEIDLQIQGENKLNLQEKNRIINARVEELRPYERETNPENVVIMYKKELKQIDEALKYFEIKLNSSECQLERLKTTQTLQSRDVLMKSSMFSPRHELKKYPSRKKIWK